MSILDNSDSIHLFLERRESGDPLKDWYDESEIHEALAEALELVLEHVILDE